MEASLQYTYSKTNGFENPLNYWYPPYQGLAFMQTYKESREIIMEKLAQKTAVSGNKDLSLEELLGVLSRCVAFLPLDVEGGFLDFYMDKGFKSVEMLATLLGVISEDIGRRQTEVTFWLDKFVHKYEVTKRIYCSYAKGFKREATTYKDITNYALLSLLCVLYYRISGNLKYLNCCLKINDLLCAVSEDINECIDLLLVKNALSAELQEVAKLTKTIGIDGIA